MRQIVTDAITQTQKQSYKQHSWSENEIEVPVVGKDYTVMLSMEQRQALKQMHLKLEKLISELQSGLQKSSIEVGTSTSITIRSQGLIVIEFSLYGDLASVFTYGDVQKTALITVDQVLQKNNLFRLLEEEQLELEKQGIYHDLF